MPGRSTEYSWSRMGAQSQQKDDEVYGKGNLYAYKFRMQDARINRFFSADPLHMKYPYNSDYAFAENDLIRCKELEGLEKTVVIYNFSSNAITTTKIGLPKAGPLGEGVLIQSNHGGKTAYYYGKDIPDGNITSFKKAYEGTVTDQQGNHIGYLDSKGLPTIGYGHLIKKGDPYKVGGSITEGAAQNLFRSDQKAIFSSADEALKDYSLTGNQKDALYDAAFNLGPARLSSYSEDGDKYSGGNFFLQYMGGGEGLKKRRYAENILYTDGRYLRLDVIKNSQTRSTAEQVVKGATKPLPANTSTGE